MSGVSAGDRATDEPYHARPTNLGTPPGRGDPCPLHACVHRDGDRHHRRYGPVRPRRSRRQAVGRDRVPVRPAVGRRPRRVPRHGRAHSRCAPMGAMQASTARAGCSARRDRPRSTCAGPRTRCQSTANVFRAPWSSRSRRRRSRARRRRATSHRHRCRRGRRTAASCRRATAGARRPATRRPWAGCARA